MRLPTCIQLNFNVTFHYDKDRFKLYLAERHNHHHHDSKLRKVNLISGRSVIMQFNANGVDRDAAVKQLSALNPVYQMNLKCLTFLLLCSQLISGTLVMSLYLRSLAPLKKMK